MLRFIYCRYSYNLFPFLWAWILGSAAASTEDSEKEYSFCSRFPLGKKSFKCVSVCVCAKMYTWYRAIMLLHWNLEVFSTARTHAAQNQTMKFDLLIVNYMAQVDLCKVYTALFPAYSPQIKYDLADKFVGVTVCSFWSAHSSTAEHQAQQNIFLESQTKPKKHHHNLYGNKHCAHWINCNTQNTLEWCTNEWRRRWWSSSLLSDMDEAKKNFMEPIVCNVLVFARYVV